MRKTRRTRTKVKLPLRFADSQLPSVCWITSITKYGKMASTSMMFITLRQKFRFDGLVANRRRNSHVNHATHACQ